MLLAGGVPVPIYPPVRRAQLEDHLRRQSRVLGNCRAAMLVTTDEALNAARLLGAARQGFETGSKRLAEMAAVREKLSTYSENGQVSDIMDGKSRVQKKA